MPDVDTAKLYYKCQAHESLAICIIFFEICPFVEMNIVFNVQMFKPIKINVEGIQPKDENELAYDRHIF